MSSLFPTANQRSIFTKINYINIFNSGITLLFWITMNHLHVYKMQHGLLIIAITFVLIAKLSIITRLGDKHLYHKYLKDYRNKTNVSHQNATKQGRLQQLDTALNRKYFLQKRFAITTIVTAIVLDISLVATFIFGIHIPFLGHLNGSTLQILAGISENINSIVVIIWLYQLHLIKRKAYQ